MLNPFGSQQNPGSYINLQQRMFQRVQSVGISDQIFVAVQNTYEDALNVENVVLSRPERKRLFAQILKLVLEDMIKKLDERSDPK